MDSPQREDNGGCVVLIVVLMLFICFGVLMDYVKHLRDDVGQVREAIERIEQKLK